jgi:hypothetical protein
MAQSLIKLPNGTEISVKGTPEEVAKILSLYSGKPSDVTRQQGIPPTQKQRADKTASATSVDENPILSLVNMIKECDDSEAIEKNILDRSSQIDRILLPLYISSQHFDNKIALTTGEMSKVLFELGVPVSQPNVAHAIAGSAKAYVAGDRIRKKGQSTKYRITRKGVTYLSGVIKRSDK